MRERDTQYRVCGIAAAAMIALMILSLITSCSSTKKATEPTVVTLQTTAEKENIREVRIDTVLVEVPAQSAERTTTDTSSYLQTDYAESNARINPDGTLYHDLRNKTENKHAVPVAATTDTIKIQETIEKPVPYPVTTEVERDFTWWEKTRLNTWWWLLLAAAARAAWAFRKPIISIAKKVLKV